MVTCLFDNTTHEDIEALHKHLRKFKIKQGDYYEEYYPKKDLLTGEKIPFKSVDQYLSAFFLNKNNMKAWFKKNPEKAKEVALSMLKNRCVKKSLTFAPSEVELVTSGLPSISYYQNNGDYNQTCNSLGLQTRFDYSPDMAGYKTGPLSIIVDTREQTPFKFHGNILTSQKLEFGDYALVGQENNIVIERKGLMDFINSFVGQFDRVEREFQRAKEAGAHLIVVCEEPLSTALSFNYLPFIKRYTKVRPEVLFHNIRELLQKYSCQFVFCEDRNDCVNTVEKIFRYKGDIRKIDIQFCKTKGLF